MVISRWLKALIRIRISPASRVLWLASVWCVTGVSGSPGLPGRPLCLRCINPCPVYPTPGPHTTLLAFLSCSRFASTNQRPFLCPGNQSEAWRVWSPHTRSLGICRLDNNRPVTTSSWFTKCNSVVVRTLHIKIDGSKMIHLCSLEFKYMPQV